VVRAAASAVEQLLLRDIDRQAAVDKSRHEMQAKQQQLEVQLQARATQLEQDLQVGCIVAVFCMVLCIHGVFQLWVLLYCMLC
jgi:RNA polymerase-interacting CarD/CdnL/TRCF family regulator